MTSIADLERTYYLDALGISGVGKTLQDLRQEFYTNPPANIIHKDTGFIESGDISATSGAFVTLGPDLSIAADINDVLLLIPDLVCTTGADTQFEAATRVSGADNRYWSTGTNSSRFPGGLGGWYVLAGTVKLGTPERYTVQGSDIVSGNVTVRFYARSSGATRTVKATSTYPLRWALYNIGPAAT